MGLGRRPIGLRLPPRAMFDHGQCARAGLDRRVRVEAESNRRTPWRNRPAASRRGPNLPPCAPPLWWIADRKRGGRQRHTQPAPCPLFFWKCSRNAPVKWSLIWLPSMVDIDLHPVGLLVFGKRPQPKPRPADPAIFQEGVRAPSPTAPRPTVVKGGDAFGASGSPRTWTGLGGKAMRLPVREQPRWGGHPGAQGHHKAKTSHIRPQTHELMGGIRHACL